MTTSDTFAPWPPSQTERDLRATIARVEKLADEWQGNVDATAITYQDAAARQRATGLLQLVVDHLRAALRGDA